MATHSLDVFADYGGGRSRTRVRVRVVTPGRHVFFDGLAPGQSCDFRLILRVVFFFLAATITDQTGLFWLFINIFPLKPSQEEIPVNNTILSTLFAWLFIC